MSSRFLTFFLIGFIIGVSTKMVFEHIRYHSWDRLEDEVDEWRQTPRGRFNSYLDGLNDTP